MTQIQVTKTVTKCNICGRDFDEWDEQEGFRLEYSVGYGSRHDGETIRLDICCDCFDELVDKCKVSPIVKM